jgi:hypothetical protein
MGPGHVVLACLFLETGAVLFKECRLISGNFARFCSRLRVINGEWEPVGLMAAALSQHLPS